MKENLSGEVLQVLIDFAYGVRFEDLPEDVVYETKRRIIDAVGCAAGSTVDPRMGNLRKALSSNTPVAVRFPAVPGGSVLGSGYPLGLDTATFLNTAMIRWLDWNDTYLAKEPAHPSDNLGLLLACAGENVSGKDLIAATAVAYDIQCRLCEAASLRSRGWDHVNYLLLSATLAGAKLLGLNKRQMYDAVAIALNSSIALRQVRAGTALSEWKGCSAAGAVRNAAFALLLVKYAGFHGPSEIMEGEFGFVKQVCGELDSAAFSGPGLNFFIKDTYLKKYPVEYHAQAIVKNALEIRRKLGGKVNPEEVKEIRMVTYEAAEKIIGDPAKRRPLTKESADHSIYYIFAVALLEGEMTLRQYRKELFTDPRVLALIDKIRLERSHDFTMSYAATKDQREFPSFVEITLRSGQQAGDFQKLPRGHPLNPMSDEEVNEKFLQQGIGLGSELLLEILDELWHLEEAESVEKLMKGTVIF